MVETLKIKRDVVKEYLENNNASRGAEYIREVITQNMHDMDQQILKLIFKETNYEINPKNYFLLVMRQKLIINEICENGCRDTMNRRFAVYYRGNYLMGITVRTEILYARGPNREKIEHRIVTNMYVEK